MSILNNASIFSAIFAESSLWQAFLTWIGAARIDPVWLESQLRDSPALTVSLAAAIFVPLLATTGALLRLVLPARSFALPSPGKTVLPPATATAIEPAPRAFLEFPRYDAQPFEIRHGIVRIGRESDNDIKLDMPSVHRYHAVIEYTTEGEIHVTYVGAPDGNGLRVNGRRVHRQRLTGGEILDVGSTQLRFTTIAR